MKPQELRQIDFAIATALDALTPPRNPDEAHAITLLANARALLNPPAPDPARPAPWKVIAVSSNHNNFGHKGVVVCRPTGEALELSLQAYGVMPLPEVGTWFDALPASEIPARKLPAAPREILDREFKPATASDFLAICGRNSVDVSVARECAAIRDAVDGGQASAADIERLFLANF